MVNCIFQQQKKKIKQRKKMKKMKEALEKILEWVMKMGRKAK